MGKRQATGGMLGRGGIAALLLIVVAALLPARALDGAPGERVEIGPDRGLAAVGAPCGGEPMPDPDDVIEGDLGTELETSYVLVPFRVSARSAGKPVTGLRVKYCFGGKGSDRVNGGSGDDWLRPGSGRDRVRCGRGRDAVVGAETGDRIAADCERVRYRR